MMFYKPFTTKYGLTSHVQNIHNGVKHQCDICGTQYNSRQHLLNHKKIHVNESDLPKFSCDFCSFETVRKESLKDHKKGKVVKWSQPAGRAGRSQQKQWGQCHTFKKAAQTS